MKGEIRSASRYENDRPGRSNLSFHLDVYHGGGDPPEGQIRVDGAYGGQEMMLLCHHLTVWVAHYWEHVSRRHGMRGIKRLRWQLSCLVRFVGAWKNGWGKRDRDESNYTREVLEAAVREGTRLP